MQRKYEPRHPSGVLCKYRGALNTTSAAPSAAVKATPKKSITVPRLIIATFLPALAEQIRFQIAQNYGLVFVLQGLCCCNPRSQGLTCNTTIAVTRVQAPSFSTCVMSYEFQIIVCY
jgi:hypothetical protein